MDSAYLDYFAINAINARNMLQDEILCLVLA